MVDKWKTRRRQQQQLREKMAKSDTFMYWTQFMWLTLFYICLVHIFRSNKTPSVNKHHRNKLDLKTNRRDIRLRAKHHKIYSHDQWYNYCTQKKTIANGTTISTIPAFPFHYAFQFQPKMIISSLHWVTAFTMHEHRKHYTKTNVLSCRCNVVHSVSMLLRCIFTVDKIVEPTDRQDIKVYS